MLRKEKLCVKKMMLFIPFYCHSQLPFIALICGKLCIYFCLLLIKFTPFVNKLTTPDTFRVYKKKIRLWWLSSTRVARILFNRMKKRKNQENKHINNVNEKRNETRPSIVVVPQLLSFHFSISDSHRRLLFYRRRVKCSV